MDDIGIVDNNLGYIIAIETPHVLDDQNWLYRSEKQSQKNYCIFVRSLFMEGGGPLEPLFAPNPTPAA